jgi:hypothetical protein
MNETRSNTSAEPLLDYFQKGGYLLNDKEKALVKEMFNSRLYRKRQYILQESNICTQFNFVVRGCLFSKKKTALFLILEAELYTSSSIL